QGVGAAVVLAVGLGGGPFAVGAGELAGFVGQGGGTLDRGPVGAGRFELEGERPFPVLVLEDGLPRADEGGVDGVVGRGEQGGGEQNEGGAHERFLLMGGALIMQQESAMSRQGSP